MDTIMDKKVELIKWLCGEDMIFQYVQSRKLITQGEYTEVQSIQNPIGKITKLLDFILRKGDLVCIDFLELLKKDDVNESRPELKDWIITVNTSALAVKKENRNTAQAGNAAIPDNEEFLRKNHAELVRKVKNVDGIVDDLNLTREMASNVRVELTDQAKMRKVLEYTNSKKAAKLLVEALYRHAEGVMEDLTTP